MNDDAPSDIVKSGTTHHVAVSDATGNAETARHTPSRSDPGVPRAVHEPLTVTEASPSALAAPSTADPPRREGAMPAGLPYSKTASALLHRRLTDLRRAVDTLSHRLAAFEAVIGQEVGKRRR